MAFSLEKWRYNIGILRQYNDLLGYQSSNLIYRRELKQMIQSMATISSAVPLETTEGTYHMICMYGSVEEFIRKFAGKVEDAYAELSTHTVNTESVMLILAIAGFERRKLCVMDVKGAYLNANMQTPNDRGLYRSVYAQKQRSIRTSHVTPV